MRSLNKSGFTENFIRVNALAGSFTEWLLCNGMLFNSTQSWWDSLKKRNKPHEGLDLAFYRNNKNSITGLDENTKIPVILDGVVIGIFDDFLGKSLFIRHDVEKSDDGVLCTIFGHIAPNKDLYPGKQVKAGEIAATVSAAKGSVLRPHIHITVGWALKEISDELLDWNAIGNPEIMKLTDPLELIDRWSLVPTSLLNQTLPNTLR